MTKFTTNKKNKIKIKKKKKPQRRWEYEVGSKYAAWIVFQLLLSGLGILLWLQNSKPNSSKKMGSMAVVAEVPPELK